MRIAIRTEAGHDVGYGHLSRALALHRALATRGADVVFWSFWDSTLRALEERGVDDLESAYNRESVDAVVYDLPPCCDDPVEDNALGVAIDDWTERRHDADLAVYPGVSVQAPGWKDARRVRYVLGGLPHVIVSPFFQPREARPRDAVGPRIVLVTCGGSDPGGRTFDALMALDRLRADFVAVAVAGPGMPPDRRRALGEVRAHMRHAVVLIDDVRQPWRLFPQADLAVATFGVTAYELAACGVPALLLTRPDQGVAAEHLEAGGAASLLPFDAPPAALEDRLAALLGAPALLEGMAAAGPRMVDGKGAVRVAAKIVELVRERERETA